MRCFGEDAELGTQTDVPVYVVFKDYGSGEVLVDDSEDVNLWSEGKMVMAYLWRAFMCERHEPRIPFESLTDSPLPPGGNDSSGTVFPLTPSTNSTSRPETAAARLVASRRSVLEGILMTISFWN